VARIFFCVFFSNIRSFLPQGGERRSPSLTRALPDYQSHIFSISNSIALPSILERLTCLLAPCCRTLSSFALHSDVGMSPSRYISLSSFGLPLCPGWALLKPEFFSSLCSALSVGEGINFLPVLQAVSPPPSLNIIFRLSDYTPFRLAGFF